MLTRKCKLYFEGFRPFKWITAGDISRDGQQVLLKSYEKVYYWKRDNNEPIWQTMMKKPKELPYKFEKQGEAIGFTLDGKGYYTTSEGFFSLFIIILFPDYLIIVTWPESFCRPSFKSMI